MNTKLPFGVGDRLRYLLERLLVRGARDQLLVVAAAIALISLVGGAIVLAGGEKFETTGAAIWWAFLRLTDPGYLGDDVGTLRRVISTGLTISGYVIFLGALVAIMTEWLRDTMEELESGLTPVTLQNHVVILGAGPRTAAVIKELLLSGGRLRRFLRLHGDGDLRIVVLAEKVTAATLRDLEDRLGDLWSEQQVILRSGSPLRVEHLDRAAIASAAAVILPAQSESLTESDNRTIKALLSIGRHPSVIAQGQPPLAVAELLDQTKVRVAEKAYPGPNEVLSADAVLSRITTQNLRHPGLSQVYAELLRQDGGAEFYLPDGDAFVGRPIAEVQRYFEQAVVVGVVRSRGERLVPLLNPRTGLTIQDGDRLVVVADSFDDAQAATNAVHGERLPEADDSVISRASEHRRILVLGWQHALPALLDELASYRGERFEVTIVSRRTQSERELALTLCTSTYQPVVEHIVADYTVPSTLNQLSLGEFDNVLLLSSERTGGFGESDARTMVGLLLLEDHLRTRPQRPAVLAELRDGNNLDLLHRSAAEFMVSPEIMSHLLAQVALRRELRVVFDELFTAGGPS